MAVTNDELRHLLHSDIPSQISKLEESSAQLERAAAYCEASYYQSLNKDEAFNETKKMTLQSLASVAYYVNSLSAALLRSLDLEAENFVIKASDVQNINQLVAIQREKMARREVGKLTINKSIVRQNKITYPMTEEKTPRYQRTPIEYSLLDGVGHGRPITSQQEYTTPMGVLNRSGSMASNDYACSNYNTGIYDHYASRTQTLTRNSMRSVVDQYRVPQVIPSAFSIEHNQQRYNRMHEDNYHRLGLNTNEISYATADSVIGSMGGGRSTLNHTQIRQLQTAANQQYRLSNDSMVEGLPPPPSLSMNPHPDDPLPPPPAIESNYGTNGHSNWIPPNYIEKARVIYGYDAVRTDELSLSEGSIVYILRKNEDGWFEGVLDGMTGLFPGNYVEPI